MAHIAFGSTAIWVLAVHMPASPIAALHALVLWWAADLLPADPTASVLAIGD